MTTATFKTAKGDIHVELFEKTAPNTVANFVKLVNEGFYQDLAFHRVVPDFVIQGGCPNTREGAPGTPGTGGPGYEIDCELDDNPEKHSPGSLSMAHRGPNTGGSQFFITHTATPHLDGLHTVFGRIVSQSDLEVVLAIEPEDRFSVELSD